MNLLTRMLIEYVTDCVTIALEESGLCPLREVSKSSWHCLYELDIRAEKKFLNVTYGVVH